MKRVLRRGARFFTKDAAQRTASFLNDEETEDDVLWSIEKVPSRGAWVFQVVAYDVSPREV